MTFKTIIYFLWFEEDLIQVTEVVSFNIYGTFTVFYGMNDYLVGVF